MPVPILLPNPVTRLALGAMLCVLPACGLLVGDPGDGLLGDGEDSPPVSATPDCDAVEDWDPEWAALEDEIVQLVNEQRAKTTDCGGESFSPAAALASEPRLRCAARKHSKDMVDRDFFDHVNPDGENPFDRMENAGYSFRAAGENIAAGSPTAAGTMQQWVESPGHCKNLMNAGFEEIGVGYYPGGEWGHMWTQVFGAR